MFFRLLMRFKTAGSRVGWADAKGESLFSGWASLPSHASVSRLQLLAEI